MRKEICLLSVSLAGLLGGVQVHAQEATDTRTGVQDIVVTAQKRSENLQNVPIAISAVTGDGLSAAGVNRVEDLSSSVPGLSVTRQGASTQLFIRGVGTTGGSAGQENAVATFIDGVYMPAQAGATFSFNNVERIEVLKGPQGTLYGRNATGGAMNVITRTPKHEFGLEAEMGYGNKQTMEGNLYVTGGLTDAIALDFAAAYRNQDKGFGTNLASGQDINKSRDIGFRSKILVNAGDSTDITLAGDWSRSSGSIGVAYRNYGPTSRQVITGLTGWPFGFWDISSDVEPNFNVKVGGVSGRIEHDFGGASLTSITAYRMVDARQLFDIDETALPLFSARLHQKDKQFTQELQLASAKGDRLNWIVGAFFMKSSSRYAPWSIDGALFAPAGFRGQIVNSLQRTTSYAAFAQADYEIFDRTKLTLGARYTIDKRHLTGTGNLVLLDGTLAPFFPAQEKQKTFKRPTWRIALDHEVTDDILAYASYNRGFQSGVYNMSGDITSNVVNPETLDAYELGLKTTLFDRRLRFNIAGFYYKYKNLQLTRIESGTQVLVNAARAKMYGLDIDFDASLTDFLSLRGGGQYVHDRYQDFPGAPFTTTNNAFPYGNILTPGNARGNRLNRTPDYSFNVTADLHFPVAEGELSTSVTYFYNDGFFWEPDNDLRQSAYSLLSGQVQWTAPSKKWYVKASGRNLLNKKYFAMGVSSELGDIGSAAPGRTYGASIGFKF